MILPGVLAQMAAQRKQGVLGTPTAPPQATRPLPTRPMPVVAPPASAPGTNEALARSQATQAAEALYAQLAAQKAQNEKINAPYTKLAESASALPSQIEGTYGQAADRSAAYSSGFSSAFNDTIGKLQSEYNQGMGMAGSQNEPVTPGLGDAIGFLSGGLQSAQTNMAGAGQSAAARFLPTLVGLQGRQAVQAANASTDTAFGKAMAASQKAGQAGVSLGAYRDQQFGLQNKTFNASQEKNKVRILENQAAQLSKSGLLFQYNPSSKTVEPVMGEGGSQIQTPAGITASQGAVRTRLSVQKMLQDTTRTVWQETPEGGFRDTGAPTGGQKNVDRTYQQGQNRIAISRGSQAIARSNLGMREIEFLQSQSPFVLTRDKAGGIVEYRDSKGNTVPSALSRTIDAAQWTKVKALSDAYTDSTGIVYLPQKQIDGSIVPTPVMNGKKPLLTKAGQERQQGDWGRLRPGARFKITTNLSSAAKSLFAGMWESKDPAFRNDNGTARTSEDKSRPELGWSIANGEQSGYINHHPGMTFGEALEDALILGAPYDVTVKALLGAGFKGGERGTPFSQQQMRDRATQATKEIQRPASLQAILSGITMPIGNNPDGASIVRVATLAGIPSEFIPVFNALVRQESGGTQTRNGSVLTSSAGALGLTQLMPGTAKALGVNPLDPAENLVGGAMYFRNALEKWGDVRLALAAYNAGPGKVREWLDRGVPFDQWYPETQNYVTTILGNVENIPENKVTSPAAPAKGNAPSRIDSALRNSGVGGQIANLVKTAWGS